MEVIKHFTQRGEEGRGITGHSSRVKTGRPALPAPRLLMCCLLLAACRCYSPLPLVVGRYQYPCFLTGRGAMADTASLPQVGNISVTARPERMDGTELGRAAPGQGNESPLLSHPAAIPWYSVQRLRHQSEWACHGHPFQRSSAIRGTSAKCVLRHHCCALPA